MVRPVKGVTTGNGYTFAKYEEGGWDQIPIFALVGQGLIVNPVFEKGGDGKQHPVPDSVESLTLEIYIKVVGADKVKLPADYKLPKFDDVAQIKFVSPTAYINPYGDYYFRASGVELA
ncbi:hypothetical protein [Weissella soli]|uniref:Uncharacterized protein n=1 Tax=Weissella soli TaxID=155866 RepID=A0A288QUS5_9LACO|nr:hypothetical protein [Weissella soli]AOT55863.1 hypothetical protein WSWS_00210 [Weissella soli]NKY83675.1 hypothetical protein [Weissella soli]RDL06463.1 hypothetical protein DFP99_0841 [Weissella soli]GEN93484.1 hypothetical protein WSO01_10960 [Weissella soli]